MYKNIILLLVIILISGCGSSTKRATNYKIENVTKVFYSDNKFSVLVENTAEHKICVERLSGGEVVLITDVYAGSPMWVQVESDDGSWKRFTIHIHSIEDVTGGIFGKPE